jgi:hypothetical protein
MEDEITTRYHLRRREFLSEDPACCDVIIAVVEDTREISDENEQGWRSGTLQLELTDGYGRFSLDFDMRDREERAVTLRKINLLAEVVNEFRRAIELEVESRDARPHVLYVSEVAVA